MAPSIIWGIGVGLIIAAADAVAVFLAGSFDPAYWPIDDIDMLLNVALFSLIGFRVARATGIVRDAAEAGVLAGVLVGLVGLAVSRLYPPPTGAIDSAIQVVQHLSKNIVLGGCLAIVAGWFGTRTPTGGSTFRR